MADSRAQANRAIPTPPKPSEFLLAGGMFRKWDEENVVISCEVRVDNTGLVLEVVSEGREGLPVLMSEVSDIRTGKYARQPKDAKVIETLQAGKDDANLEELCMSVVYGTNMVDVSFLNLVGQSAKEVEQWALCLQKLTHNTIGHNQGEDVFLKREYARICATRQRDRGVPSRVVQQAFAAKMKQDELRDRMLSSGWATGKGDFIPLKEFTYEKFCDFHDTILGADFYDNVLMLIAESGKKPIITAAQLCKFLNKSHRDPRLNEILFPYAKESDCRAIINKFESSKNLVAKNQMAIVGLKNYLRSSDNLVIHPSRFTRYHDMDQPLCRYFISSSHNTYLTGKS